MEGRKEGRKVEEEEKKVVILSFFVYGMGMGMVKSFLRSKCERYREIRNSCVCVCFRVCVV